MSTHRTSPPPALRLAGTSWGAAAALAMGAVAAAAAVALDGAPALRGVGLATALVCGFFLLGALNTGIAAAYAPGASLVVALLTYVMQVVGLGVVLLWLARSGALGTSVDAAWLGGTVIAGTLAWTAAMVLRAVRSPEVRR